MVKGRRSKRCSKPNPPYKYTPWQCLISTEVSVGSWKLLSTPVTIRQYPERFMDRLIGHQLSHIESRLDIYNISLIVLTNHYMNYDNSDKNWHDSIRHLPVTGELYATIP